MTSLRDKEVLMSEIIDTAITEMSEITETEIAEYYANCIRMVDLVNDGRPSVMGYPEWEGRIDNVKEYLSRMMNMGCWTDEDLSPLEKILEM